MKTRENWQKIRKGECINEMVVQTSARLSPSHSVKPEMQPWVSSDDVHHWQTRLYK